MFLFFSFFLYRLRRRHCNRQTFVKTSSSSSLFRTVILTREEGRYTHVQINFCGNPPTPHRPCSQRKHATDHREGNSRSYARYITVGTRTSLTWSGVPWRAVSTRPVPTRAHTHHNQMRQECVRFWLWCGCGYYQVLNNPTARSSAPVLPSLSVLPSVRPSVGSRPSTGDRPTYRKEEVKTKRRTRRTYIPSTPHHSLYTVHRPRAYQPPSHGKKEKKENAPFCPLLAALLH